ncbi:tRNA (guanine-N(1)-)-methyltransferase domain protein [Mycobacterium xenopi 4042]|uniref:tRNA (Guanine-N(1)-)-methyltransferase domain protein n=1 Tax=Mycobacterium xenopi 4042 TaxID=1299334 RepID=X8E5Q1_MYCXE|nr:tRNA (guanine-N(1)-)-methyltransferase domain protein [Mycobacterium xenopi 4042]
MRIDVVTIFPSYMDPLRQSLPGKAIESGWSNSTCTTCGAGPMMCTAPLTTPPTVAARDGDEGAGLGRSA